MGDLFEGGGGVLFAILAEVGVGGRLFSILVEGVGAYSLSGAYPILLVRWWLAELPVPCMFSKAQSLLSFFRSAV